MKINLKRNKTDEIVKSSRNLRERFLADPYRPQYHFTCPEDLGIPGDPNGAFYANGRYHLMYLYDRRGSSFCWGHISSIDLVHWHNHPDAIAPGEGDSGCFSGGAFLDDDGTAYLSYWKLGKNCGIGIAKSTGPNYDKWEKIPGAVVGSTKFGIFETKDKSGKTVIVGSADPSNIWKKDGIYYMGTGNLCVLNEYGRKPENPLYKQMRGDWVDLFKSTDLIHWEYIQRFYDRDQSDKWTDGTEDDMCPSFLPLSSSAEGGTFSGKYLQLFIAHNKGCQYYIGEYDKQNDKFIPERHGRMSWIDNTFFAPEALIDNKGRQIMWAWLLDNPGNNRAEKERGWSGVYGLPRVLWLGKDGNLRMTVPPEFQLLRLNKQEWKGELIKNGQKKALEVSNKESCELAISVRLQTAKKVGLIVRASPYEEEFTKLYYNSENSLLEFDAQQSSLKKIGRTVLEKAPLKLESDEKLKFRIFIDRCVVELFANDRQAITRRVFPTRSDSIQISLFAEGGDAFFEEITAWEINPSNPY